MTSTSYPERGLISMALHTINTPLVSVTYEKYTTTCDRDITDNIPCNPHNKKTRKQKTGKAFVPYRMYIPV